MARYEWRDLWREPSTWSISIYRLGRWLRTQPPVLRLAVKPLHTILYGVVRIVTGIDIPSGAEIGPGLKIEHFGGVTIHEHAVIGARATVHHGVTIGAAHAGGQPPRIGDGVIIGAYGQIIGPVRIGDDSTIGAMTVVLHDVPSDAIVVGNPARVVGTRHQDGAGLP